MNSAEQTFKQLIDDHISMLREFDALCSRDERRLCMLYWLMKPAIERLDWMDVFDLKRGDQLLTYISQGDTAQAGEYLTDLITDCTREKVRDIYDSAWANAYPEKDENKVNRMLFDRNEAA